MPRLDGVRAKIKRAEQHIDDLDIAIRSFCESKPYTIGAKPHPIAAIQHTTLYVSDVRGVPTNIVLLVGDAVHNLRSSLDHLVWQLVTANNATPTRKTCFPISNSLEKYASAIKRGVINGVCVEARELIGNMQCHVTGDYALWLLGELDNIDKHRLLITVISRVNEWSVDVVKGRTISFNETAFIPLELGCEIVNIPTTTYERQCNEDFNLGIDVAFGEPKVAEGQLVLITLKKLAEFTERVVGQFERFLG